MKKIQESPPFLRVGWFKVKHCPNCGHEITDEEEFCTECGYNIMNNSPRIVRAANDEKGFFDNLVEKTSFPVMVFAFVIFGVFLFVGALFWSSFLSNGSLDLITYLMLTIVFAVFSEGYLSDIRDVWTNLM